MPAGESFVGRGVDCQLRFNDAAVSRRHLRVICTNQGVFAENLSMTNGTRINGDRLKESRRLRQGDTIEIGHRVVKVLLEDLDEQLSQADSEPVTISGPIEVGPGLMVADDFIESDEAEMTRPGHGPAGLLAGIAAPDERNCPKCRARVQAEALACPTCGYRWPFGGPASRTQEIVIADLSRRAERRHAIRVPVIYSSEYLTLDATARDLSRGGMFIASELLDPVGTSCEITALPDGRAAVLVSAEVCHVSTEIVAGRPPGFGVRFTTVSESGVAWLESITSRKD